MVALWPDRAYLPFIERGGEAAPCDNTSFKAGSFASTKVVGSPEAQTGQRNLAAVVQANRELDCFRVCFQESAAMVAVCSAIEAAQSIS
jgi:hypothetical protein